VEGIKMANIMINEMCNLQCSYCFADEFVNKEIQKKPNCGNMTFEDFKRAVDFVLKDSPRGEIRIIGGEPTLHPEFKKLMEYIINDSRISRIHIFTNGLLIDKFMSIFSSPKVTCLINLNSPNDMGEIKYKKTMNNIRTLINEYYQRDKITIGINMYKEGFDYEYIVEAMKEFKFDHVRVSISIPMSREVKDNILDYFHMMKPRVFEFFNALSDIGAVPHYDCNMMPGCITTAEEKAWLYTIATLGGKKDPNPSRLLWSCSCGVAVDILPDLRVVRCFGLSEQKKVYMENFNDPNEVIQYFLKEYDDFAYNVLTDERCKNCEEREKRKCMGGCLAFKINKINDVKQYIENM